MKSSLYYKNLAVMLSDEFVTVRILHFGHQGAGIPPSGYTYACTRVLADELTEGDVVIVKNDRGWATGEVVGLDGFVHLDPDVNFRVRFIVQKVASDELDRLEGWQDNVSSTLMAKQREEAQRRLRDTLGYGEMELPKLAAPTYQGDAWVDNGRPTPPPDDGPLMAFRRTSAPFRDEDTVIEPDLTVQPSEQE